MMTPRLVEITGGDTPFLFAGQVEPFESAKAP